MEDKKINYKKGLIWGFIFGTIGLWVLALLALIFGPVEVVTKPFFWPGRIIANLLSPGGALSSSQVKTMYLVTGVIYAIVGMVIQLIIQTARKQKQ